MMNSSDPQMQADFSGADSMLWLNDTSLAGGVSFFSRRTASGLDADSSKVYSGDTVYWITRKNFGKIHL